ncbi:hypothetical protein ABNX05_04275 [Lysinibacillus sp. M3]|uniref:Uncharacterized protein n=1 Tax=Lysinibacillus zambalensis TaxID=3160866 RepID=A0ABV1MMU5_9BACI
METTMVDSERHFKKFLLLWSEQLISAIGSGLWILCYFINFLQLENRGDLCITE